MQKFLRTLTLMALLAVPWVTQAQTLTVADGTETNEYVPFYGYWADAAQNNQMIYPAADLSAMVGKQITQMVFYVASQSGSNDIGNWTVSLGETSLTTLSGLDNSTTFTQVYSGAMNFGAATGETTMTIEFTEPYTYNGGNLLVYFEHSAASYKHYFFYGITATGAAYTYNSARDFLPKVTFTYETPSSCTKPGNITYGDISGTTAAISWTAGGSESSWNVYLNDVLQGTVNTPSYNFTGLNSLTTYSVGVEAICGSTVSAQRTGSFTTPIYCANGGCEVTVVLTDAYGDGGGQIQVLNAATNDVLETYTNGAASTSYTLYQCKGTQLSFVYASTDSWAYENGYTITDNLGNVIAQHEGCSSSSACTAPTAGEIATYTLNCSSCYYPTEASASNITTNSATLSWTPDPRNTTATYTIFNVTTNSVYQSGVTGTSINITGLSEDTEYEFTITTNCSGDETASPVSVSFTTFASCPIPTALTVDNITAHGATLGWTALNDSYNVRYREQAGFFDDFENGLGNWTIYTQGEANGEWRIIDPSSGLSRNAHGGSNVASAWSWNNIAINADNWLVTPQLTLGGTLTFWETTNSSWPDEYEVILSTTGNTVADFQNGITLRAMAVGGDDWTERTFDLSGYTGQGYIAIHHVSYDANYLLIDDFSVTYPSSNPWTSVNSTTTSTTITGLAASTTYEFQVQGVCGSSTTEWSALADFTTAISCPAVDFSTVQVDNLTAHEFTFSWTAGGQETSWIVTMNDNTPVTVTGTPTYTASNLMGETRYDFTLKADCGSEGESTPIAFYVTTPIACYAPTSLAAGTPTTSSVELSWTNGNEETAWQICVNGDENNLIAVNANPYTLSGLTASTDYTVKVRANCGGVDGVSAWSSEVSFTTASSCPAPVLATDGISNVAAHTATVAWTGFDENNSYVVSYRIPEYIDGVAEEFNTTSKPEGWNMYTGLLNNILEGSASLVSATSGWNFGTGNNVFGSHARTNIYGSSWNKWLVTPAFTVPNGAGFSFDMALTVYTSSSSASPTPGNQADDKFVVLISTDDAATWTILRQWDNAGSQYVYDNIPNTGENVNIDLSSYAGQNVKIAFYGESTVSGGDNNLHIDNVIIGVTVPATAWQTITSNTTSATINGLTAETPYEVKVNGVCAGNTQSDASEIRSFTTTIACPATTDLTAGIPTPNSVELSWTENGVATAWQLCINGDENNLVDVTTNPYTLTGLANETEYTVKVRANCGGIDGQSAWSNTVTFTTQAACPAPILEASGITQIAGHTADVAWTGFSQNNSYVVSYRIPDYVDGVAEEFSTNTVPSGWTRYTGLLSSVLEGSATLTTTTSGWMFTNTYVFGQYHAKLNIYGTTAKYWLVTPEVSLPNGSALSFDMALTDYNNANGLDVPNGQADDKFVVLITTNDGATWNILREWNNSGSAYVYNNIATAGESVTIDLGAYSGNVKIAFYGESTVSATNEDNDLHIDNVSIGTLVPATAWQTVSTNSTSITLTNLTSETPYEVKVKGLCSGNEESLESEVRSFTTTVSCPAPDAITVTDATTNSITLTWTDNHNTNVPYTLYNIGDNNSVVASGITATTYTVTGLNANTSYTFGVAANCGNNDNSAIISTTGRTACEAMNLPWTCGFEENEILSTTAATALPYCSYRYASGTTNLNYPYSYSGASYAHDGSRSLYYYGTTGTTYPEVMAFILPEINVANYPMNGNRVKFYARMGAATNSKPVKAYTLTDPTDWSTATYVAEVTVSGATYEMYNINLDNATATDAYLALVVERGTGTLYLDDLTFEMMPACLEVSNLAVESVTSNSITLTWTDAINNSATTTYSVYNVTAEGDVLIQSGITATNFTVTGLEGNTQYTLGVQANCTGGDTPLMTVSDRTACDAISLPWTCGFEADEIQSTTAATALPWCSFRYVSPEATSGTTYPYSYSGTTYAHESSRCLYYYGTTGTAYPEVMAFILPQVDVNSYPMNGNRVKFYARMSSTSYTKPVKAYTLTDPTDWNTATYVAEVTVSGTTHQMYSINLNDATATDSYLALVVERGSGTLYLDDLTFETMPTCLDITDLTATSTSNSVSLTWTDAINNSATTTYSVYNVTAEGNVLIQSGVAATNYTVTGLDANTEYTFGVAANCALGNAPVITVNIRTACAAEAIPFVENFDATLSSNPCWGGNSSTLASDVFDGTTLTLGAASAWTYVSSTNNGIEAGHYKVNIYGTTCKKWLVTPAIDLTNAPTAQLSFDAAFTVYTANSSDPATGFENNMTQAFMVLVSTDGGATWPEANAVKWLNEGGDHTLAELASSEYINQIINLNQYIGQTIRIAFYAQSTTSGGDNNIHIDNIAVTEVPNCLAVTELAVSNITTNSAVLTWTDTQNDNASYTIMNGDVVIASGITATTYTLENLTSNTNYTISVYANCTGADATPATVNFFTLQMIADVPYTANFEDAIDNSQWTLNNGSNAWYIGSAATDEGNSLFISNDGINHAYGNTVTTVSSAFRMLRFTEAGWYSLTFDWKANGESTYDYLRVALVPADATMPTSYEHNYYQSLPDGWIALDGGSKLNLSSDWNSERNSFQIAAAGQYKLVMLWSNDNSQGNNPPAAVDNIIVKGKTAFEPTDLAAEVVNGNTVNLTWTRDDRNVNETYTVMNGDAVIATNITGTSYTINNVTANADYSISVYATVENENSDADNINFGIYQFPTETGKMVCVAGTILNNTTNSTVTLYRGLGDLTVQNEYTSSTYLTATNTNYTTTNLWDVYGPVTVAFVGENATGTNTGVANLTASYVCPTFVKTPEVVTETANGAFSWTTPEGVVYNYTNHRDAELAANENGDVVATYRDTVRNAGNCDSIINTLQLTLHPDFVINVTDQFCEGTTYTVGTGNEAQSFTASAQQNVLLHTVNGADSLIVLDLQMNPAPAAQINNRTSNTIDNYCDGADLVLNARSNMDGVTFQWEDQSTDVTRTVNPSGNNNIYTLIAINPTTGCQSIEPATLTVNTTPVPELTVTATNAEICYGKSTTLSVTDANNIDATYRWSNNQTGSSITVTPNETTTYTVTATTTGTECVVNAEFTVTVNPLPVVQVSTDVAALCANSTLTLTATTVDGYNYEWNTGATTAVATTNPTVSGTYTVTVTDANGCVNEFTTNNVTVYPVYELNDVQSVCYTQNPYTWGTQTITANGNYDQTFQSVNGCDSLVHLTFTFEQMSINNTYREVCQNSEVTWGTQTITAQENTTLTYELGTGDVDPITNTVLDCPAQYNLILTVNPVKASSFEQVACDSYTWNVSNETYTQSGAYPFTLKTTKDCDSVVTMNLTVNYQNTGIDVQTACDSYIWPLNNTTYTESTNEPTVTLQAANEFGCDSVVTLNLTVNYKTLYEDFHQICDSTYFTWLDGQDYTLDVEIADGIVFKTGEDANGCDSIAQLHLDMNYVLDTLNWVNKTECDNFYIDVVNCDNTITREYISESGDVIRRTRNADGHDQITRIHLTISTSDHQTVIESQCVPWTWVVNNEISHTITSDTVLSQELQTESGCQLIKVLRFTAKNPTSYTTEVTLCQDGSWTDGNQVEYLAANYELGVNEPVIWNQTVNEAGCDSVDYVVFTVNPVYSENAQLTFCESEFTNGELTVNNVNNANESIVLTIPATGLDQQVYTNTVTAEWTTAAGCDSTVTINYTVNPTVTEEITVQNCYTYTWNGRNYNTLGQTDDTFETVSALTGCDSIAVLHLTLTDTVIGIVEIQECGEFELDGVIYRENLDVREVSENPAQSGCDSVTIYRHIVVPRIMEDVYVVANAPYTWVNGRTYDHDVTGIYADVTDPNGGCDHIMMLTLTMKDPIALCENSFPYTTDYGVTIPLENGLYEGDIADTHYVINYTAYYNTVKETVVSDACDSYTWADNGETYEVSGNYSIEGLTNAHGCDSTHTLVLTVNYHSGVNSTEVACDSYTWNAPSGDRIFTESGVYYDTTLNLAGCPNIDTLNLTINVNQSVEQTLVVCDSIEWNGQMLTATGDYDVDFTDINNCAADSVLHLTVNVSTENNLTVIDTAASTYYNGNYYADIREREGNDYNMPYTFDVLIPNGNAKQCDSVDHVTLYVTRGEVIDENFNICGDFTWERNNRSYTWISDEESQAHENALYKDITDATAPIYIHTGENPMVVVTDAMGVPTQTYVLWLNMIEANYYTVDLGTIMLSDVTSMDVNPGDSLNTRTLDFSEYFTAHQSNANYSDTIHHISTYYCENVVTYTANLVYNFDTVDPVTVCDVTTWTDPVNGEHAVTIGAATEIDYITADNWRHHVVVNVTARTTSDPQVVTVCDTYTWTAGDGQTYTTSGSYPWNDDVNCTAETLQLTINTNAGTTNDAVACDTYTWEVPTYVLDATTEAYVLSETPITTTYTNGGEKTVTFTDVNGCQGTATLNLTINVNAGNHATVVNCDSYDWTALNGSTYHITATKDTAVEYQDVNGCWGYDTLSLTINVNPGVQVSEVACDSMEWFNQTYTQSGVYTHQFADANGCLADSVLTLTINVNQPFVHDSVVLGNGITIDGQFYPAAIEGVANYVVIRDTVDINGCATQDTIKLHVSQYQYLVTNKVECGSYTWDENGNNHYYRILTADELAANPNALYWDETGNYAVSEMPRYSDGYMIYLLNLTLNAPVVTELEYSVPMSQLVNGTFTAPDNRTVDCSDAITAAATTLITQDYSMKAIYPEMYFTACDSIVRYKVNVIYNYFTDEDVTVCATTTYTLPDNSEQTMVPGNDYSFTYTLNAGLVTEEVHTVAVTDLERTVLTDVVETICYGTTYTWTYNGENYGESTDVNGLTVTKDDIAICDQQTLFLTVRASSDFTAPAVTACASYDQWTVNTYVYDEVSETWILGEPITTSYTESGDQTVNFVDANGCAAVATLPLTINPVFDAVPFVAAACDTYTWTVNTYDDATGAYINVDVDTYTESAEATYTAKTAAGCDSVINLTLTLNNTQTATEEYWFGNGSYRYTGIHTTATGHMYVANDEPYGPLTETVTGVAEGGCDSIYTITLHVGNNYTHTEAERSCNEYTWARNGETYVRLTDAERAENPTALYRTEAGDMIYANPVVIEPRDNDYADEYMLDLTLDAIHTEDVTVDLPVYPGIMTYGDSVYNVALTTHDLGREFVEYNFESDVHFSAVQYCDSIVNLTVNVINNYVDNGVVDLCYAETTYEWEGESIDLDHDPDALNEYYIYHYDADNSVVKYQKVIQHPIQYTTERRTECNSYEWNGRVFTESTSGATVTLADQYGCDSTVTLTLTINYSTSTTIGSEAEPLVVCNGYEWTLGDQTVMPDKIGESGVYTQIYTTADGCESFDTLYLTVNYSSETEIEVTNCGAYTWENVGTYDESGVYTHTFDNGNVNGCDSTVTLTLTVYEIPASIDDTPENAICDSYEWHGMTYDAVSGTMVDTLFATITESATDLVAYAYNENGCQIEHTISAITIDYSSGTTEVTACDSYEWYGETYKVSGTYQHVGEVQNACGNLTDNLILTINHNSGHTEVEAVCSSNLPNGYMWHDELYFVSGEYYYYYNDDNECPSIDTLDLTIGTFRAFSRDYVENCGPYTWDVTGETFEEVGYTEASSVVEDASANGCDSVIFLYLTIYEQPVTEASAVICDSELPYSWRGMNLTETGEYSDFGGAHNEHCDSVFTMNLTVKERSYTNEEAVACDSYEWNGETYTESGIYTYTTENAVGCDSIVTIDLTVNHNNGHATNIAWCDAYTWVAYDQTVIGTYALNGTYTYEYYDANNCPSIDTLNLTISSSVVNNFVNTACDSYTWIAVDGTEVGTYTESVQDTFYYSTVDGCSGMETLNLTVNYSNSADFQEVACDSYVWFGTEYTQSGEYTHTITNVAGCDSVMTLDLRINKSNEGEESVSACNYYTWNTNGVTYTTSGDYTTVIENVSGCDSTITLHLTVNNPVVVTIDTTVCGSLTWNGIRYDHSDVITHTFTGANGCDSTEVINLTINNVTVSVINETACDSYTWDLNGETYTESGMYVDVLEGGNVNGCDSSITLFLTINANAGTEETVVACNSYEWNNTVYTTSGDYTVTFTDANNCTADSVLHLTIGVSNTENVEATACDSYTWNGNTYTASGVYNFQTTNVAGCDSVVTINLTINYSEDITVSETACDSYVWADGDGETYTTSGTYVYNYTTDGNCAGVKTLTLTVNNSSASEETATACDSYTWNGETYTTSGVYTHIGTNNDGCNDTITLTLTINGTTVETIDTAVCGSFTWVDGDGETYSTSGIHTFTAPGTNGCDVQKTLYLTIQQPITITINQTACDNYAWNGTNYTTSGEYTYQTVADNGCDSVVTLNLTVNNSSSAEFTAEACNSYIWNGANYTVSGDYTYSGTTTNGCDSTVTLHLTINQTVTNTVNATACDSYTWNNVTYYETGVYTQSFSSANDCDSIVTLNLTINSNEGSYTELAVCDSYTWNGTNYTQSGTYTHVNSDNNGCNGTDTLVLTVNQAKTSSETAQECVSYNWNGSTYTTSGTYTYQTTSADGCDSIVTLTLTINQPTTGSETVQNCDAYLWNGTMYTTSGDYTYQTVNAAGCDSTVTLHLTINQPKYTVENATACGSFVWNGVTYTQTGEYTNNYTAVSGCDSIVTLNLTINQPVTNDAYATACDSYIWEGTEYTTTGNYTHNYSTTGNCDSVVTLHLTINPTVTGTVYTYGCDSYTWENVTYTTSGVYTNTFPAANGCDSVVTMNLTIYQHAESSFTAAACDSYTWEGTEYTTSGTYTHNYPAANGCDSIVTMILTVNHPVSSNVIATACDSYTWDNDTYTTSGNYTHTYTAANGCDSVVTLTLTVNNSVNVIDEVAECDGFIWIDGINYTASTNTPTVTLYTAAGCDSVITLHLTINHSVEIYDSIEIHENQLPYNYYGNTIESEGDFMITGTTVNGCDSTVYLHVGVIADVAIDVTSSLEDITVYPNPTRGQSTVTADDVETIEVFDMVGHLVAKFERTNRIDITNLAEGSYTLRITTPNGTAVRRLIKK